MILLHYKNVDNTGVDWTLVYHPLFDGPIEIYENDKNCIVEYLENKYGKI